MVVTPASRLLPYIAALIVGVTAGVVAGSPVVAGLVACAASLAWLAYDRR